MLEKLKSFKIKKNKYPRFLAATFFVVLLSLSFVFVPKIVGAISGVRGAAWWGDDLKFVYFNCNDYEAGSRFDVEGNFENEPSPLGFHFHIDGCVIDHGVQIDNSGNFFGAAFNYKKGMINFGGSSTPVTVPDYSFNSNCLKLCDASNFCSACYNSLEQKIYGYAQASSTGELIRLDTNLGPPLENDLRLKSWNLASSTKPFYSTIEPGDFIGHASSTIAGVRHSLSFNCLSEYGSDDGGSCTLEGRDNYKVYIKDPEIGQMTAPNWSFSDACNCAPNCSPGSAKKAILKWSLNSGAHSGFEIAVTKTDVLATSSPDTVCYSGFKLSTATQYTIPNSGDTLCTTTAALNYNTSYYWFIRLYYLEDSEYKATEWYQFGVNDSHQGELYDLNNGPTNPLLSLAENKKVFTTYKHEFPTPYFTWTPEDVKVGSTTIFTALDPSQKSVYYTPSSPTISTDCDENAINCGYLWEVTRAGDILSSPSTATTTIIFQSSGDANVKLTITDPSDYSCTITRQITNINYELPVWREVKAE